MQMRLLGTSNRLPLATEWSAFGTNPAVGGTFEHIWSHGGVHTEISTAAALHISSSSNSDTFNLEITGLDADWNLQTVTQALVGQTETTIAGVTWIRVFRIRNAGAVAAVGDVYCYLDDTVTAGVPQTQAKIQLKMPIGYEQSLAARLSVPDGKTGYIVAVAGSTGVEAATEINLMYRAFGGIARVLRVVNLFSNGFVYPCPVPIECAAKSDVFLQAKGGGVVSGEIVGFYENA
jgi:hypothetical protein